MTEARASVETPVAEPSLNGRKRVSRIAHLILGITIANDSDERGAAMLNDLYAVFRTERRWRLLRSLPRVQGITQLGRGP
jgi:hypothetical protein